MISLLNFVSSFGFTGLVAMLLLCLNKIVFPNNRDSKPMMIFIMFVSTAVGWSTSIGLQNIIKIATYVSNLN